jgi:hypothetical protein
MADVLPTVRILDPTKDALDYLLINERDFDPRQHIVWSEVEAWQAHYGPACEFEVALNAQGHLCLTEPVEAPDELEEPVHDPDNVPEVAPPLWAEQATTAYPPVAESDRVVPETPGMTAPVAVQPGVSQRPAAKKRTR